MYYTCELWACLIQNNKTAMRNWELRSYLSPNMHIGEWNSWNFGKYVIDVLYVFFYMLVQCIKSTICLYSYMFLVSCLAPIVGLRAQTRSLFANELKYEIFNNLLGCNYYSALFISFFCCFFFCWCKFVFIPTCMQLINLLFLTYTSDLYMILFSSCWNMLLMTRNGLVRTIFIFIKIHIKQFTYLCMSVWRTYE